MGLESRFSVKLSLTSEFSTHIHLQALHASQPYCEGQGGTCVFSKSAIIVTMNTCGWHYIAHVCFFIVLNKIKNMHFAKN